MSENTSMNREVINVKLTKKGEKDVMIFDLCSDEHPDGIAVDLNSEQGQLDLKVVFSALLEKMLKTKVALQFLVEEDYSVNLFKEVCKDYIEALNKEIEQVYDSMKEELEI